jgi:DNA-binding response OmpR family regulator
MRILMVSHDAFSNALLSAALKSLGHQTVAVANGQDAIDNYRKNYFPVVISEWMMPQVSGLELCRLIRAENAEEFTYIILFIDPEDTPPYTEALKAGADDFIPKPFDENVLVAGLAVAKRILKREDSRRKLAQLIVVCAYCKKPRNDPDYWQQLDKFLMDHPDLQLSHGICPACYENTVRPQLDNIRNNNRLGASRRAAAQVSFQNGSST